MRLLHIGVHNSANQNAGDTLLFPTVRKLFDHFLGNCHWELRQAWDFFSPDDAIRVNNNFDGVVIGGGGLLLRDQAGSDIRHSGWQWNSTVEAVRAIKVPLLVFAIGYNRFRYQPDFDNCFAQHINQVVEKSAFVGLRNTGSINALKGYLSPHLRRNVRRQHCPTTLLWQLYPGQHKLWENHDASNGRTLAFNAAFDRPTLRFGHNSNGILNCLAQSMRIAQERGWKVTVCAHKSVDLHIQPHLDAAGVSYEISDLTNATAEEIVSFYAKVDLAVGMRGHAQMIPFGLRRPIMSLISHDKMRFFLDDIGRPELGVEVDSEYLTADVQRVLSVVENRRQDLRAELQSAQQKIWNETEENFYAITNALKKTMIS